MLLKEMLAFNGIDPERFQARWISGSEAAKFRDTVAEVSKIITEMGPNTYFNERRTENE